MATTKSEESKAASEQPKATGGQAKPAAENPRKRAKKTGAAKRKAKQKVGAAAEWSPINLATAALSAAAQEANGRSAIAAGRKSRAAADVNVEAFSQIKVVCVKNARELAERALTSAVLQGAELNCDRLRVIVEVEAMSSGNSASSTLLDDVAFISKRRDSIHRLFPGPGQANTEMRAKFGLHEQIRPGSPASVKVSAQRLLGGKKALPNSRAAMILTADDDKRLRAIIKAQSTTSAARKEARMQSTSRTTDRDILNAATELFYDDYAACIGLVLEGDEVARLRALELIPRRAERRAAAEEQGGSGGAGAPTSGSTSVDTAASAPSAVPASAATTA